MKRVFMALMTIAAIVLTSCKDSCDDPQPQSQDGIIQFSHKMGEKVTNPTHSDRCIAPLAEQTLSSLRRISDRFYYMDFATDLSLQTLVNANLRTNQEVCDMMNQLWFTPEGYEDPFDEEHPIDNQTPACSGFICFNEAGELLFGRNFDGAGGPLCMVFNKVNGTYDYVQFTAPNYNSVLYNGYARGLANGDGILSDGTTSLHRLLRQPVATMDGMNEHGLCFGAFQLPYYDMDTTTHMPKRVMQNEEDKHSINSSMMHNLILSECKTVNEVEQYLRKHNYCATHPSLNVHWMVADATGDYAVFEYWEDTLYVLRAKDREDIVHMTSQVVPYEYNSIENYYCNLTATYNYLTDKWQNIYSSKVRVQRMMMSYYPVMSEMQALKCLQQGSFGIEMLNELTNWSCIYNTAQRTILFCLRNDMSKIYKLDLKKELTN